MSTFTTKNGMSLDEELKKELKLSPRNYCSSFILLLQVLPIV